MVALTPFVEILRGDGDGGFACQESIMLNDTSDVQRLAAGDFDMDGDLDLVVGSADGRLTTVRSL